MLLAGNGTCPLDGDGVSASANRHGFPRARICRLTRRCSRRAALCRGGDQDRPSRSRLSGRTFGAPAADQPAGDSEARQLRLHVHLARELGLDLQKGVVVRADGRRVVLDIADADAVAEGQRAREELRAFNAEAAEGFKRLAEPSPEACRYCPCIPFCEAFWEKATAVWADQCGLHLEGTVSGVSRAVVQNTPLITLELAVARGTTAPGAAVVQQLPEKWACADGVPPPEAGDVVRVVDARLADDADDVAVIRPDRLTTALWTVCRASAAREDGPDGENNGAGSG